MPLGVIGTRNCFALRLLLACSAAALPWDPACYRRLTTYWQLMWSYPCTLATHRVFIAFHSPSAAKPSSHHACYSKPHTHTAARPGITSQTMKVSLNHSHRKPSLCVCCYMYVCHFFYHVLNNLPDYFCSQQTYFLHFLFTGFQTGCGLTSISFQLNMFANFCCSYFFFLTPKIAFDKGLLVVRWGEYSLLFQIYSNGLDCSVNKRALCVCFLGNLFSFFTGYLTWPSLICVCDKFVLWWSA